MGPQGVRAVSVAEVILASGFAIFFAALAIGLAYAIIKSARDK